MLLRNLSYLLHGALLQWISDMAGHGLWVYVVDANYAGKYDALRGDLNAEVIDLRGCRSALEVVRAILSVVPVDDPVFGPPARYIVNHDELRSAGREQANDDLHDQFFELIVGALGIERNRAHEALESTEGNFFHEAAQKEAALVILTSDPMHFQCYGFRLGAHPEDV